MDTSSLWLIDLACIKHTSRTLPSLVLALIREKMARIKVKKKTPVYEEKEESIVVKGARKAKWAKHIMTKFRIKRAFRYR